MNIDKTGKIGEKKTKPGLSLSTKEGKLDLTRGVTFVLPYSSRNRRRIPLEYAEFQHVCLLS